MLDTSRLRTVPGLINVLQVVRSFCVKLISGEAMGNKRKTIGDKLSTNKISYSIILQGCGFAALFASSFVWNNTDTYLQFIYRVSWP